MRPLVLNIFTSDMLPLFPPFPVGKALGGYRGKATVPVEVAFPPVFNMAGAFNGWLGVPLPLRVYESPSNYNKIKE
jgi:hypothetical protein